MKPDVREAPINIRAKTSQRDLIDMAASLVSKSRTDFMLRLPAGRHRTFCLINACSSSMTISLRRLLKSLTPQ